MALQDDGLISGLREDQLVTAEEVDSAVREVRILAVTPTPSKLQPDSPAPLAVNRVRSRGKRVPALKSERVDV